MSKKQRNIKLILAYDGTHYLGWQKNSSGASIEASVQKCLEQILQHPVRLLAASRTDAGVHALGQVVNFLTEGQTALVKLQHSLNCLLPVDIKVISTEEMPLDFHATLDVQKKEYHYHLCFHPIQLPLFRFNSWHYPNPLNIQDMHQSIPFFLGEKDFTSFTNVKKNETYSSFLRTIDSIEIQEVEKGNLRFIICGKKFLYKMVRNIVGSLVYIGCGKISKEQIPEIFESKNRSQAGITAPAHGLTLFKIY